MQRGFCVLLLGAVMAPRVHAVPWVSAGSRAMGMGGAQVAAVEGPLASFANPAALGYGPGGFAGWGGGRLELRDTALEGARDLYDIAARCPVGGGGPAYCTNANAAAALGKLQGGAFALGAGGVNVKVGRLAIFADTVDTFGISAIPDLTNATIATLANNRSALIVRGGFFSSLGAGFGSEILETGLLVGGAARVIHGRMGFSRLSVISAEPDASPAQVFERVDRSFTDSVQPGIDLGLVWDVQRSFELGWGPRFGVAGRNLNSPRFSMPAEASAAGELRSHYSLPAQARAGAALSPFSWVTLAVDVDLTRNRTALEGYFSREAAVGLELVVPLAPGVGLPLRVGVTKNVAESDSASFTAGVGLKAGRFELSLSGSPPRARRRIQSLERQSFSPDRVEFAGAASLRFGDYEANARRERVKAPMRALPSAPRPARREEAPVPREPAPSGPKNWDVDQSHLWVR